MVVLITQAEQAPPRRTRKLHTGLINQIERAKIWISSHSSLELYTTKSKWTYPKLSSENNNNLQNIELYTEDGWAGVDVVVKDLALATANWDRSRAQMLIGRGASQGELRRLWWPRADPQKGGSTPPRILWERVHLRWISTGCSSTSMHSLGGTEGQGSSISITYCEGAGAALKDWGVEKDLAVKPKKMRWMYCRREGAEMSR